MFPWCVGGGDDDVMCGDVVHWEYVMSCGWLRGEMK